MHNQVNVNNLTSRATGTPKPPTGQAPDGAPAPSDQFKPAEQAPELVTMRVPLQIDKRMLEPDASGRAPIQDKTLVFVPEKDLANYPSSDRPVVGNGQLLPPDEPGIKYITADVPVPEQMLIADPMGRMEIDKFGVELVPKGAVVLKPEDYQKNLEEANKAGKAQALPKGFAPQLATSKEGQLIEGGKKIVGQLGYMTGAMSLNTLAHWITWIPMAWAAPLAGIGGAVGVFMALDQLKQVSDVKGRLTYLKSHFDAMDARNRLAAAEPEKGPAYIEALRSQFKAQAALDDASNSDDVQTARANVARFEKKLKKSDKGALEAFKATPDDPAVRQRVADAGAYESKTKDGAESGPVGSVGQDYLNALDELKRAEAAAGLGKLQTDLDAARQHTESVRKPILETHPDLVNNVDKSISAFQRLETHYAAQRGEPVTDLDARLKALEVEGAPGVPQVVQGPDGKPVQVIVPFDKQIKELNYATILQSVQGVAGALGVTGGLLAAVGIGCPPLLAAAAILLPLGAMMGKPLFMLGKGLAQLVGHGVKTLWNNLFNKDRSPTVERVLTGEKAKPETPEEQAAYDKAVQARSDLVALDQDAGTQYLNKLTEMRTLRATAAGAPEPKQRQEAEQKLQEAAIKFQEAREALVKAGGEQTITAFETGLDQLGTLDRQRTVRKALEDDFHTGLLASEPVKEAQLGDPARGTRVLTNLLLADLGDPQAGRTVQTYFAELRAGQPSADSWMARVLIDSSKALNAEQTPLIQAAPASARASAQGQPQSQAPSQQQQGQTPTQPTGPAGPPQPVGPSGPPQAGDGQGAGVQQPGAGSAGPPQQQAGPAQGQPPAGAQQGGPPQPTFEEHVADMVVAALNGDQSAQQQLAQMEQRAAQGDQQAIQFVQVAQAVVQDINRQQIGQAQSFLQQAGPEYVAGVRDKLTKAQQGDQAVGAELNAMQQKAQAGDSEAAKFLNVLNALVIMDQAEQAQQAAAAAQARVAQPQPPAAPPAQ